MQLEEERQSIVRACQFMQSEGLVVGTAGNVSLRVDDLVVVSPSGVDYSEMEAQDVCVIDLDGNQVAGELKPSSEVPLHLSVYRSMPEVGGITHNHAPASSALGLVVDEVPTSHYYTGMFGGAIRVAPYSQFGTDQLAADVTAALKDRKGALMGNHGAITVGADLNSALSLLSYLEYICEIQLRAMATGCDVHVLSEAQIESASAAFTHYGQRPRR
jgi:L-fuculose-phosphate aldolase